MARPATTIHFLMTGGTIDSEYNGRQDLILPNSKSVIPEFIRGLRLGNGFKFNVVCMKDSRELNQIDRQMLLNAIELSPYKKIIITHGLYTITETARYLAKNLKRKDQAIILVGSLLPIRGFAPSDGPFNLGFCVAEISHLKRGLFVLANKQLVNALDQTKLSELVFLSSPFSESPSVPIKAFSADERSSIKEPFIHKHLYELDHLD